MHGGMCGICKDFIVGKFHVDHVIPLSRGGEHSYANAQLAHPTCNLEKWAHA
jgi:5-methylcytosine-specific restriction endonuclease McrA